MKLRIAPIAVSLCLLLVCATARAEDAFPIVSQVNFHVAEESVRTDLDADYDYYTQLVDAVLARAPRVRTSPRTDAVLLVTDAFRTDDGNPLAPLVTAFDYQSDPGWLGITYALSEAEQTQFVDTLTEETLDILNGVLAPDDNTLDIVLKLYRYVAGRFEYDEDFFSDGKNRFESIGVCEGLRTGRGVCHTYAYTLRFLLQQMHIPVCVVTSDDGETSHAWLAVSIYGANYFIDPTWESVATAGDGLFYFGMTEKSRTQQGLHPRYGAKHFSPLCTDDLFESIAAQTGLCYHWEATGQAHIIRCFYYGDDAENSYCIDTDAVAIVPDWDSPDRNLTSEVEENE